MSEASPARAPASPSTAASSSPESPALDSPADADAFDAFVHASAVLTYGAPGAARPLVRRLRARVAYQPAAARLLIEPDAADARALFLPLRAGCFVSYTARAAEGDKEYEDALMERLSVPPVKGDDALHWLEIANEVL